MSSSSAKWNNAFWSAVHILFAVVYLAVLHRDGEGLDGFTHAAFIFMFLWHSIAAFIYALGLYIEEGS